MKKYIPSLQNLVLFSILSLALIYGCDHLALNANAETTIKNCYGCVNNTSTQVLTIFNFQTNDNPFLAGNATFLITPNPYAHTTNATDYIDLTTWFNFVISDGESLDKDPTPGIIELTDVNNGTYSIMQIRGTPGFGLASPEASDEILGTTGFAYTTQTFFNFTSNDIGTVESPNVNATQLYKMATTGGGKINNKIISNSNDLPTAKLVSPSQKLSAPPPDTIVFTRAFAPDVTTTTLIDTLGIPTYSPPSSNDGIFMPPVFVAPFTSGSGKIMTTPIMDVVSVGSQIMIRGDNVNQGDLSRFKGIELPMNTDGTNVAVSVTTDTVIPTGKPPLPSGFVGLYLDVQTSGSIDFSNSNVYDPANKPTITFTLPKVDGGCPTNVTLNLEHNGSWHPIASNITSASIDSSTCTYSVDVDHFSSYLVSTGSATIGHNHGSSNSHTHTENDASTEHSHAISDCTVNGLIRDIYNKRVYLQIHTNSDGDITTNTGPGDFYTPGEARGQLNYVYGSKTFTTLAKPSNEILTSQSDKILWGKSKATATASFETTNQNKIQYTISGKNLSNIVGISLYLGDQYKNSDTRLVDIIPLSTNLVQLNSDVIKGIITNDDMCPNSHSDEDGTVSHDQHASDPQVNEDGMISHDEHIIDTHPKLSDITPGTTCYGIECIDPEPTGIIINDDSTKELPITLTVVDTSLFSGYNFGNDFSGKKMIVDIYDKTFPITYNLNGEITKMTINEEEKSLSIYLDNVSEDKFTLRIPRELVDETNNNFLVMVTASPEKLTEYEIISSNDEFFTIQLIVPDNTSKVTIIGTRVIPEFGGIVMMILGIAIVNIIAVTAKTKMFVRF